MGKQKKGKANKKKKGGGGNSSSSNRNNRTKSRNSKDASSSIDSLSKTSIPEEVHLKQGGGDTVSLDGVSSVDQPTVTTTSSSTQTNRDPEATPLKKNTAYTELKAGTVKETTLPFPITTDKMGNEESKPEDLQLGDEEEKEESEKDGLPTGLKVVLNEFTDKQQELAKKLCSKEGGQSHLFDHWSSDDTDLDKKKDLMEQLEQMDDSYPNGGLMAYLKNAKELLEKSKQGVNPLEGWSPAVPKGENFSDILSDHFQEIETIGKQEVGNCGFVLVAGGLGERLGYSDIKIGLPTELATETCYIEYYLQVILAFQNKFSTNTKLPLCIMTSSDTNAKTIKLLEDNNYFGFPKDQLTIVQQGLGVPALENNDARIAIDKDHGYKIQAKPHGHGDVHALMYSEGVASKWLSEQGIQWICMFQDTNGLAFHTLPLALGLSSKLDLIMNSLAVPRKAGQAIGGIAKLTSAKGDERTINVEYNQLDPLLKNSSDFPDGDANDPQTGYSPFPGNINQLIFQLEPYMTALERCHGAMPEFVNPKYADDKKMEFKKPTRLECMMQDFPTVLQENETKRVGFTCVENELCFSPVKNATSDGVALQKKGIQPGVAATGEQDQYQAQALLMRSIGCHVEEPAGNLTFKDIQVHLTPAIVLKPNFVSCPTEYLSKFPSPSDIKISNRSSLVVDGKAIVIKSLDLDGALVIKAEDGYEGDAIIDGLVVKNKGWVNVSDSSSEKEVIQMRGYRLSKLETSVITFKADGTIEGDYTLPSERTEEEQVVEEETNDTTTSSVVEQAVSAVSTILPKTNGSSNEESAGAANGTDKEEEQPQQDDDEEVPEEEPEVKERSMPLSTSDAADDVPDLSTPGLEEEGDNDEGGCEKCVSECSIM